ncbi:T9SS type A sorting domain-containing protein [Adhaeribacter soli]|nr:YCF48-related protein [Adhaeribacter soli]
MKAFLAILVSFITTISAVRAQWVSQPVPSHIKTVRHVAIVDQNVIWAQAFSFNATNGPDKILRTTNGGLTWSDVNVSLPGITDPFNIFSLKAVNASTAYITVYIYYIASGANTRVYKTTDAGLTWSHIPNMFTTTNSFVNQVEFFDANNGVIVGDMLEFYTTSDGGTTWTRVPASNLPPAHRDDFSFDHRVVIGNTIWVPAGSMRVYKSTDKGLSWTVSATNIPNIPGQSLAGIAFQDAMNGLISKGSALSRTTDGGLTWTAVNYSGSFFEHGLTHIPGTPNSYVSYSGSGTNPGLSISQDGGLSWTQLTNNAHHSAAFITNRLGWSGGNGVIYKLNGNALNTSEEVAFANSFVIYPNPSQGIFTILPAFSKPFDIEVYDLVGNKVKLQQGNSFGKTMVDLSGQKKGIYLLHILRGEERLVEKIALH